MSDEEDIENLTDDDINDLLDDEGGDDTEDQDQGVDDLDDEDIDSLLSEEETEGEEDAGTEDEEESGGGDELGQNDINDLLSQDEEVDDGGASDVSPDLDLVSSSRIEEYDFLEPSRFNRSELEKLKRISSNVAQRAAQPLSRLLQTKVQMQLASCDQTMWQYMAEDFGEETVAYSFSLPPLGYDGLLAVDAGFCCSCLECLTGGDFETGESDEITDTDARVFSHVAEHVLEALPDLWEELGEFEVELEDFLRDLQSAAPFSPGEDMFQMSLLAEGEFGTEQMAICTPFEMVRDLPQMMGREEGANQEPDEDVQEKVCETIRNVPVELSVDLGQALIPGRQILDMEPGDVIVLDSSIDQPLQVRINNRPKLSGRPVKSQKNLAIKIEGEL